MTATPTCTHTPGKFVWREHFARDLSVAKRFYGELFGWTFTEREMGGWTYTLIHNGGRPIAGMVDLNHVPDNDGTIPPHWAVNVSVPNVDEAVERALARGGKLLNPCMDIPETGRFAVLQDDQGAVFNVFYSFLGDPAEAMPVVGEFCWENLVVPSAQKAIAFYTEVIGWGTTPPNPVGVEFTRQALGEAMPAASVIERGDMGSFWQTFVFVDDLDASTKQAVALGASPMGVPIETPGARILTCQDPGGAYFCMFSPNAQLRASMARA